MKPAPTHELHDDDLRALLVERLARLYAAMLVMLLLLSVWRVVEFGWQGTMTRDVAMFVLYYLLFLNRRRVGIGVIALALVLLPMLHGASTLWLEGLVSTGWLALALASMLSVLLIRPLGLALLVTTGGLGLALLAGVGHTQGWVQPAIDPSLLATSPRFWVLSFGATAVITAIVVAVHLQVVGHLTRLQAETERQRRGLDEQVTARTAELEQLIRGAPLVIIEEDWSRVRDRCVELKAAGVHSLGEYFSDHPEEIKPLEQQIRTRSINPYGRSLYGVDGPEPFDAFWNAQPLTHSLFPHCLDALWDHGKAVLQGLPVRIDGQELHLHSSIHAVDGHEATWSRIVFLELDVSESVRDHRQLRSILESVTQGVALWDEEGRLQLANDQFFAINAFTPESFPPGMHRREMFRRHAVQGFYGDGDREALVETAMREFDTQTASGGRRRLEYADGRVLSVRSRPVAAGGRVTTYEDVTEEAQNMRQLTRLSEALSQVEELVVMFDAEDRIVFFNEAWRARNEPGDHRVTLGMPYIDHLRAVTSRGVFDLAAGREEEWVAERMAQHRNPGVAHLQAAHGGRRFMLRETRLRSGGQLLLITDVTETQNAAHLAAEQQRLMLLSEMSAAVAHELNQPLHIIRMAGNNMRRRIEARVIDPDYLLGKLGSVDRQVVRAADIIRQMQMLGRRREEGTARINPDTMLNAVVGMVGARLGQAKIRLESACEGEQRLLLGDPADFQQMLLCLLFNARDAVADRPLGERIVRITIRPEGRWCELIVEDSGPGIPVADRVRVFDPFYTTREVGQGKGLGLSVTSGIVRGLGGVIEIGDSAALGGARVVVRLPMLDDVAEPGRLSTAANGEASTP